MLTRKDILSECVERCLTEMYKYAQPSLDFKKVLKDPKYKEDKDNPLYMQHYLSEKNFKFIKNHYLQCYGLFNFWEESVNLLLDCFKNGGIKHIYVPATDEKPAHKDYGPVDPLYKIIGEEPTGKVIKVIEDYKDFYYNWGSHDLTTADFYISLGCSPTSNKEAVIEYWKSKGKDITIKEIDVESIYYGDDYVEEEIDE